MLSPFYLFHTEQVVPDFFSMACAKSWRKNVILLAFGPLALP